MVLPDDITVGFEFDQSPYVTGSMWNVGIEGMLGAVLTGLMVFLFPGALVCVLAGASRMRVRTFLLLNFTGTVAVVLLLRVFAHTIEGPIEAVQRFNDHNFKWLTAVGIVGVLGWVLLQRKQGSPEYESVTDIERQLEGDEEGQANDRGRMPPPPEG